MILIEKKAKTLDMSVNAYVRAKALGEDYIEKPPTWLRDVLLKLYVEMSRQGNRFKNVYVAVERREDWVVRLHL